MEPIIKWAGGKRQLLNIIQQHFPQQFNNYYEPFVGGGAVVFGLMPDNATINDYNEELTNLYRVVKDYPRELIEELQSGIYLNVPEVYYVIRGWDKEEGYNNLSPIKRAARILYLNHTCYNGLYRVNAKGYYNTPFGRYKNPTIFTEQGILELSRYLQNVVILTGDYNQILGLVQPGDFVYLDPPYAPISPTAAFTSYIAGGWDTDAQVELFNFCTLLDQMGVFFMESNSSANLIRRLYAGFNIEEVEARRSLAAQPEGRHNVTELLIKNY